MGKAPCCDKANVKKGPWSPEEDAKLREYIEKSGTGGNWISLPAKAGLRRCGKSCRLRWLNYLRPNIKHGDFTDDEDRIICTLYASIGSRWSIIAAQLPGRTDNDIKNYWNTKLKKKKLHMKMATESPKTPQYSTKLQINLEPSSVISSSSTTITSCNYNDTLSPSLITSYVKEESSFSLCSPFGLQTDHEYVQEGSIKRFGGEVDSICSDGSSNKQVSYNKEIEHDYFGDLLSNTLDVDLQGLLCFGVNQSNQWGWSS